MLRKFSLIIILIVFYHAQVYANFDFNSNCIQAYNTLLALKLKEGKQLVEKEKTAHPQNSVTLLLDNYYDFFYLFTTDNKTEFEKLKTNKAIRINLLEKEDQNSPYYNFSIAQVNLQWALLNSRFAEFTTAGLEINKAYKLLQANSKKYPDFLPNNMPLGVVNVLLGSLPDGALKSVLGFFGIKGDTQTGVKLLQAMASSLQKSAFSHFDQELAFYLTYIQTDVMNDPQAYSKMQSYTSFIDNNSLLKYYIAGYVSLRTGHSTEAITLLQKRPVSEAYQPYPYLDYLLALAKMNRQDTDASNYFNKFLMANKGANFIKDVHLHLAWLSLFKGDMAQYQANINQVKANGNLYNDKDKQALDEANDAPPNVQLLNSRLLFDGGYYTKAIEVLKKLNPTSLNLERDKIEYSYRLGRINDALAHVDDALKYYQTTINIGRNSDYHYAATSSIRMGIIYEQRSDKAAARHAYRQIFNFKNRQFKNSLQQKAKEGLKRVGG